MQEACVTGAPHGQHHQVARFCIGYFFAGLDNLAERLMADDQIIAAIGRCSVLKRDNFAVGAAHADVQYAHLYLGG